MYLKEFKELIEQKKIPEHICIIHNVDNNFIINQYINFLKQNTNIEISYIDDYKDLFNLSNQLFGSADSSLKICKIDNFKDTNEALKNISNLWIICNKISNESKSIFSDYVIEIPKLEEWQILDYAKTITDGLEESELKNLISICNDIYRLDNELQKITIFPKESRKFNFQLFKEEGIFNDLNNYNIFNFTTSIITHNIKQLFELYRDIKYVDVEPIGLLILLIKNFKNIIDVQLSVNASAESLGLKPNQYWAIKKHSCGFYTKEQLMYIYSFLTDLDKKIKLGEMPMEYLVDYIICKVMTCV